MTVLDYGICFVHSHLRLITNIAYGLLTMSGVTPEQRSKSKCGEPLGMTLRTKEMDNLSNIRLS